MVKIKKFPNNDKANGWSAILGHRESYSALNENIQVQWAVIGGGFAGLAAARRLALNRPNDQIVMLDASVAGENASGRNSGFGIDTPHTIDASMEALNHAQVDMRLSRAGLNFNEAIVNQHAIDCDWGRRGKYQAAASERGKKDMLQPLAHMLDTLEEPYRWVEGDDLRAKVGTPHYISAIYTPGCVLMNPAALCRGLTDTMPENVTVFENTPVIEFDHTNRNHVVVTTRDGSVMADKVILAVNGCAPQFGFYRNKLIYLAAHASLSRPLNESERQELGCPADWGITPVNAFVSITQRYTRDYRLLIRQNIHYCPGMDCSDAMREQLAVDHQRHFHQRFPMLDEVTMDYTWTGYVAVSGNHAPGFGQVAPNVYTAVCQNAVGVAKGTVSGMLAADLACGEDNSLIADMESLGSPTTLPPRPILDLGVRTRMAWEGWTNRHER